MKISLNFEPVQVTDSDGHIIFEAPLFDLSLLIGNAITQAVNAGADRTDQSSLYGEVARALNEHFEIEHFTFGSASELSKQINSAINELKKKESSEEFPPSPLMEKLRPSLSSS